MYAGHFDFAVPMLQRVPALYSRDECAGILDAVRDTDWLAATINTAHVREVNEKVRNSVTALVRDHALALQLWDRIRPHLPASLSAEWSGARRLRRRRDLVSGARRQRRTSHR